MLVDALVTAATTAAGVFAWCAEAFIGGGGDTRKLPVADEALLQRRWRS